MMKSSMSFESFMEKWECVSISVSPFEQRPLYIIAKTNMGFIKYVGFDSWKELHKWSKRVDHEIMALYLIDKQQEYIF